MVVGFSLSVWFCDGQVTCPGCDLSFDERWKWVPAPCDPEQEIIGWLAVLLTVQNIITC